MITSGSFAKLLWPGLNAIYGAEYSEHPVEYTQLFDTYKSDKAYEEDLSMSGLGLAQIKTESGSVTYDNMMQGFLTRYTHVEYALGFVITRIMMEDNLYAQFGSMRAKALARSLRQTKEILAANVYNRAFNSSYTGGDGKELLSNAHVNKAGGTWSNILAVASDLSEASLEQATIDLGAWTDDRGMKMAFMAQSLIIPTALEYEADRILHSPYRVGTSNNDINSIKALGKFPKGVAINHYLTDADAWFIKTNAPDGMKYFERRADSFGTDNEFDTSVAKFQGSFRCSFGWSDPRALIGSPGA